MPDESHLCWYQNFLKTRYGSCRIRQDPFNVAPMTMREIVCFSPVSRIAKGNFALGEGVNNYLNEFLQAKTRMLKSLSSRP